MRSFFVRILPLLFVFCAAGCGYQIGYLGHPQLKTIAVAPVSNETLVYNAAAQARAVIAECFQTDGTMKVVDEKKADCIIYAKVTSCQYRQISWSSITTDKDLKPDQWTASITITYSILIPGRASALIKDQTASGSSTFTSGPDQEISRSYAVRQAVFAAAKNIVIQVTEAW